MFGQEGGADPKEYAVRRLEYTARWYENYLEFNRSYFSKLEELVKQMKSVAPQHKIVLLASLFKLLTAYCESWVKWLTSSEEAYRTLFAYAKDLDEVLNTVLDCVIEAFKVLYSADEAIVRAVVNLMRNKKDEITKYEACKLTLYTIEAERQQSQQTEQLQSQTQQVQSRSPPYVI